MRRPSTCVAFLLVSLIAACDSADDGSDGVCVENGGYQTGVNTQGKVPTFGDPSLQGIYPLATAVAMAAGTRETLLVTVPADAMKSGDEGSLTVSADGGLNLVSVFNPHCTVSGETYLEATYQVSIAAGMGDIVVAGGDGFSLTFPIRIVTPRSLGLAVDGGPDFAVGDTKRVCATALSDENEPLYADASLSMTTESPGLLQPSDPTRGAAVFTRFDSASACQDLRAEAAGPFTVNVSGLGLTNTFTLHASTSSSSGG